jgi:zinc protease
MQTPFAWTEHRLANGLRVILAEDRSAPVIGLALTYNAGSRDEQPGRSGIAHLFEHLMFQGSANVGKGEHMLLVSDCGGNMNGTTSEDRTNYYLSLPSNQLELALFLEADRMRSLELTPANFENQRSTVIEERLQNYDNRPYGLMWEKLLNSAYEDFPYRHSVIGSMEDLHATKLDYAENFYRTYYAPNNAVLTLAGDFDTAHALSRIEHNFGSIPGQTPPPVPTMQEETPSSEKRLSYVDPLARLPQTAMAWKIPPGDHADYPALHLLAQLLARGYASRLHQRLVQKEQVAVAINAYAMERRGPSLFVINFTGQLGRSTQSAESMVYEELTRLTKELPETWEWEMVCNSARLAALSPLRSALQRAVLMGTSAVFYGDPGFVFRRAEQLAQVQPSEIAGVIDRYLQPMQRTVLETLAPTEHAA